MPTPSVWMIRLSLIYLLLSASLGGLLLVHKAVTIHPIIWTFLPVHFELAIWGWLVQFVMGTAYWMFPKKLEGARRGPVFPAWCMVILFNLGIISLIMSIFTSHLFWAAELGRGMIAGAMLLFAGLVWQRIVTYRDRK